MVARDGDPRVHAHTPTLIGILLPPAVQRQPLFGGWEEVVRIGRRKRHRPGPESINFPQIPTCFQMPPPQRSLL